MKKIVFPTFFILLLSIGVQAQRKSELISEIEDLKSALDSIKTVVVKAKKNEKASMVKAESYEAQVAELQDANATLMKNLNTFAEISSKSSENVNRAMASLREKENQLKAITDALAKNDSTAIVVLANAKQTLGENAKIGVANGMIIISEGLDKLFGDTSKTSIIPDAEPWLQSISKILTVNPEMALTIEGLTMTGELDIAAQQAIAVMEVLCQKFAIDASRIRTLGKDGNFKEGVNFKIHPRFDEFYLMVRDHMKNGAKN